MKKRSLTLNISCKRLEDCLERFISMLFPLQLFCQIVIISFTQLMPRWKAQLLFFSGVAIAIFAWTTMQAKFRIVFVGVVDLLYRITSL